MIGQEHVVNIIRQQVAQMPSTQVTKENILKLLDGHFERIKADWLINEKADAIEDFENQYYDNRW
jgi:hypothetical protein